MCTYVVYEYETIIEEWPLKICLPVYSKKNYKRILKKDIVIMTILQCTGICKTKYGILQKH